MARHNRNYAAEYARRQAKRLPGQSAREASGHDRPEVRARRVNTLLIGPGAQWAELRGLSPGESKRANRYEALTNALVRGRMSPAEFRRRTRHLRPIVGHQPSSDPDAVLARLAERQAAGEPTFIYLSGRAA